MTSLALSPLLNEEKLSLVVNAPNNAAVKPYLQKLVREGTKRAGNPVQQIQARKSFLLHRYQNDAQARQMELSQLLYGYLASDAEELVENFASYAKEKRGKDGEIFFSPGEMESAIAALKDRCTPEFLFLHTYAFALLQNEPLFLEPLVKLGGEYSRWVSEVQPSA
ncbi:MAG: hypothetical protein JNM84_22505 [Planctomycetes bacterium]|nr:hypothetical protein [Planctomycetota bacterium]